MNKFIKIVGLLLLYFLFILYVTIKPNNVYAQLYCRPSGSDCIPDTSHTPNPDCPEDEDPCWVTRNGELIYNCGIACTLAGEWGGGNVLTACNNVDCKDPEEPLDPLCNEIPGVPGDYECIMATGWDCSQYYGGVIANCRSDFGDNGNCCSPPEQASNTCTIAGGRCFTPDEQEDGHCPWPYSDWGLSCFGEGNPPGTICCQPSFTRGCPNSEIPDGYCAEDCGSDSVYSEDNICQNPSEYPPDGWECCLPRFGPEQPQAPPQEVFCDATAPYNGRDPDHRTDDPSSGRIATAIGCIPVRSNQEFVEFLLRWGAGISGGIALILIVVAGIMFISSSGDPKRMQAAKQLLTAAVSGLLLLIFGVFILEFIGVDILGIPGFGS